jgi:dolichyl-phosphate-mannose-protein mannosyltransferase
VIGVSVKIRSWRSCALFAIAKIRSWRSFAFSRKGTESMSTEGAAQHGNPSFVAAGAAAATPPDVVTVTHGEPWARRDTVLMLGAVAIALVLYFVRLGEPPRYIYDEVYHAYTAARLAEGNRDPYMFNTRVPPEDKEQYRVSYEWSHPALAKLPMQVGIELFGDNTFGWRFSSAIFGAIGIAIMYVLGRTFFDRRVAVLGTGLLLVDGLWFVQSRTAMNDIFLVCFLMIGYLGFFLYLSRPLDRRWRYLWLSGLGLGLAVATKWSALYSVGLIGLLAAVREAWLYLDRCNIRGWSAVVAAVWTVGALSLVGAVVLTAQHQGASAGAIVAIVAAGVAVLIGIWAALARGTSSPFSTAGSLFGALGLLIGALLALPAMLYVAGYVQFFTMGWTFQNWRDLQWQMWWYHSNLDACHDWASPWWTWPMMIKPTWYYVSREPQGTLANVFNLGNPLSWWLYFPAMIGVVVIWIRGRFKAIALGVLVLAYFGQWLPWSLSPRISYFYHALPMVPFACLALAYLLTRIQLRRPRFVTGYLAVVVLTFVFFYPIYIGLRVSNTPVIPLSRVSSLADVTFTEMHYWLPWWQPGKAWSLTGEGNAWEFRCPSPQNSPLYWVQRAVAAVIN